MSFASAFKNFGHAIASGAKYFEHAVVDAIKVTAKVSAIEPEAQAVITALVGPQAAALSDLGFHLIGDVGAALSKVNADAVSAAASNGVNVSLDVQTITDVKAAVAQIEALLAAKGTPAPQH